ncbi:MAG: PA2779 family protein [Betaproteobacteria bacterium]|nr:PA2779 family protein [Betaproteobacteria bacterium]
MNILNRSIARVLVVCVLGAGLPLPASAGIVPTDQVAASAEHDRVKSFLDRADVRAQLEAFGVDANTARERVDALTADEAKNLASRIDQLPAGGDVIGVLFAVFIILLITDILGLTKIFPFTRAVR